MTHCCLLISERGTKREKKRVTQSGVVTNQLGKLRSWGSCLRVVVSLAIESYLADLSIEQLFIQWQIVAVSVAVVVVLR